MKFALTGNARNTLPKAIPLGNTHPPVAIVILQQHGSLPFLYVQVHRLSILHLHIQFFYVLLSKRTRLRGIDMSLGPSAKVFYWNY